MSKQFNKEVQRKVEEKEITKQAHRTRGLIEKQQMDIQTSQDAFVFYDVTWFSLSLKQIVKKGFCKSFMVTLAEPLTKDEVKARLREVFG